MIYLGLDLGSKTLGLSISDRTSTIATSLEVIRYETEEELLRKLKDVVINYNVDAFVLGNPKNLDGSLSDRSKETLILKDELISRYNIDVVMEDERFTSVIANNMLISNGSRRKDRKTVVDKLAASLILQSYLDRSNNGR